MVINYFKIKPSNLTESELDEYSKYIGLPLYKEAIINNIVSMPSIITFRITQKVNRDSFKTKLYQIFL
ncbi:hypothetical protein [Leptospira santarosai]|uniref:hypothetical protein n=1 Tax=Leptospira santarosai TaxID=28183 RepID=UPI0024AF5354|nr:hypothetical protein [Leptospira santarosai]MDI7225853.1 hypothetical protein [Leptospira santarosai]